MLWISCFVQSWRVTPLGVGGAVDACVARPRLATRTARKERVTASIGWGWEVDGCRSQEVRVGLRADFLPLKLKRPKVHGVDLIAY